MGKMVAPFRPMGLGRVFTVFFLPAGFTRQNRPKGLERGFTMSENFKFEKTVGKGDAKKVIETYTITGMNLIKAGESWKIDPRNQANLATFKGIIGDFPQFAGSLLNTMTPVFLRGKLPDGFRGTLRQAVEAACSGKVEVVRSAQFSTIAGILAGNPKFDPSTMPKTAWKVMGFEAAPTDAEIDAVRNGKDPWMESEDSE